MTFTGTGRKLPVAAEAGLPGSGQHGAARQPGPFDRALALLDILLGCATLVVEHHDPIGTAREVGDDEADARVKLARMPLDLGDHPPFPAP